MSKSPGGRILLERSLKDPGVHHIDWFVGATGHKSPLAIVSREGLFTGDLDCQLNPGCLVILQPQAFRPYTNSVGNSSLQLYDNSPKDITLKQKSAETCFAALAWVVKLETPGIHKGVVCAMPTHIAKHGSRLG